MTTPTQPTSTNVQIAGTEDLLAAVPHLLGFHPADSLVVIGLHGNGPTTIGLTLRVDLPPPELHHAAAQQLVRPLVQHDTTGVVLLVVGGTSPPGAPPPAEPDPAELPHRTLTARLEATFVREGIPVVHRLWLPETAQGAPWACYDDVDCHGTLPDPTATPLAAAAVLAGAVTRDRREDLVAGLAAADERDLARRSRLFEAASREQEPGGPDIGAGAARFALIGAAIDRSVAGPPTLSDDEVLTLAEALTDHRVRDACLIPDTERVAAAENLWTALIRATPAPEQAEPACLLAFSAYLRGDGVLAGIALDHCERADPGHRLAGLLRNSLTLGLPPHQLRAACADATRLAVAELAVDQHRTEQP